MTLCIQYINFFSHEVSLVKVCCGMWSTFIVVKPKDKVAPTILLPPKSKYTYTIPTLSIWKQYMCIIA